MNRRDETLPASADKILWLRYIVPLALFLQVLAWLRWGVDVPFLDDWRTFQEDAGSFSLGDLFRPANDTLYVTGKLLDALAVRFLAYNTVAYQSLSMLICLGGIIALNFSLIRNFVQDSWIALPAFLSFLFVIQPGSYWGLQNIAYHQAIPIASLLLCIFITLGIEIKPVFRILFIALLSLASGFAYISGAFSVLSAAIVSMLAALRAGRRETNLYWHAGIGYAIGATVTVPAQLWVVFVYQHGHIHRPDATWLFPWDWEFWAFVLGMLARSIRFPTLATAPWMSLAISLIVLFSIIAALAAALEHLVSKAGQSESQRNIAYLFVVLSAGIGFYALMVGASRASLGADPSRGWVDYFSRGGARFHFFWITILIPWTIIILCQKLHLGDSQRTMASIGLTIFLLVYAFASGAVSYGAYFRQEAGMRQGPGLACIQERMLQNKPVICQDLYPADITSAIYNARSLGASFARYMYFPKINVSFRMVASKGGAAVDVGKNGLEMIGDDDPQIYFETSDGDLSGLSKCKKLKASGVITYEHPDFIQLFYLATGDVNFSEKSSTLKPYNGNGEVSFELVAESENGFRPQFRIDPGAAAQKYIIKHLSLTCQ